MKFTVPWFGIISLSTSLPFLRHADTVPIIAWNESLLKQVRNEYTNEHGYCITEHIWQESMAIRQLTDTTVICICSSAQVQVPDGRGKLSHVIARCCRSMFLYHGGYQNATMHVTCARPACLRAGAAWRARAHHDAAHHCVAPALRRVHQLADPVHHPRAVLPHGQLHTPQVSDSVTGQLHLACNCMHVAGTD